MDRGMLDTAWNLHCNHCKQCVLHMQESDIRCTLSQQYEWEPAMNYTCSIRFNSLHITQSTVSHTVIIRGLPLFAAFGFIAKFSSTRIDGTLQFVYTLSAPLGCKKMYAEPASTYGFRLLSVDFIISLSSVNSTS